MLTRPTTNRRAARSRAVVDRKRLLNRARVARRAVRAAAGLAVYQVEIGGEVLDMLVRLGWLQDGEALDRQQVNRAISAMLADAAHQ
jgi:hypothetical protein